MKWSVGAGIAAFVVALGGLTAVGGSARSGVSADEAERLKRDLTPVGAERKGNDAGTIPAWEGGYRTVWPGYESGQPRPDPFAGEKPILQITAKNLAEHEGRLSEGIKALLQRFPSYRIDVYPTHRTAAAPNWVYENTYKNATRASTREGGLILEGAWGGTPFPIPKTGAEVIWNHQMMWRGEASRYEYASYVVTGKQRVLSSAGTVNNQSEYHNPEAAPGSSDGLLAKTMLMTTAPPYRVGENFLVHEPINQVVDPRRAWLYLTGQRRVRRTPILSYDNPNPVTSGFSMFDEGYMFNGAMDRYDWKLLGKREMYIPYNTHQFHTKKIDEVLGPDHLNPDHVRWELHRVWVVEATLAAGKRHVLPKRRFYLDEDTWMIMLADGWDARGTLWHVGHVLPFIAPELPAVMVCPYVVYDLLKDGYTATSLFNERHQHFQVRARRPESEFSPAALAATGLR
jgi:Protein of unknown function (DUF1329)